MKVYRDMQPGETLQAGDEKQQWPLEWMPVDPAFYGANPGAYRLEYRRPVNLPVLQPVTPGAMAELEGRGTWVVLFRHKEFIHCRYCVVKWDARAGCWWGTPTGVENPLDWHWFIEPSTIPEVQQ